LLLYHFQLRILQDELARQRNAYNEQKLTSDQLLEDLRREFQSREEVTKEEFEQYKARIKEDHANELQNLNERHQQASELACKELESHLKMQISEEIESLKQNWEIEKAHLKAKYEAELELNCAQTKDIRIQMDSEMQKV
jgi:hypothetical protein